MTDPSASELLTTWLAEAAADTVKPAIPAATVVLVRDGRDGVETLMVRKRSKIAFGGMWVFPGGKIDPDDHHGTLSELDAAVNAAVREAREETGLVIDHADLVRFSFWVPPREAPKRFATWFFMAPAPRGSVSLTDGEMTDHRWVTPARALADRDAGEVELAPPTWVTLSAIAHHDTAAEALAAMRAATPQRFATRIGRDDDNIYAIWEGDAGYETADPAVPGPRHRLVMRQDRWEYLATHR